MAKKQLGVIFGSRTCEHEVSIISGVQLARAADREKYDVWPIYIAKDGRWYTGEKLLDIHTYTPFDPYAKGLTRVTLDLTAGSGALISYEQEKGLFAKGVVPVTVTKLDCVIPVMHGLHGEDGTLQGLLELANIPYSSTGVAGSAIGMDKIMMKQVFRGMGHPARCIRPAQRVARRARGRYRPCGAGAALSRILQARVPGLLHRRQPRQRPRGPARGARPGLHLRSPRADRKGAGASH